MTYIRRSANLAAGLITALIAVALIAPSAFAETLAPDSGGGQAVVSYGWSGWSVAVIAVGAALCAMALTMSVGRVRVRHGHHALAS